MSTDLLRRFLAGINEEAYETERLGRRLRVDPASRDERIDDALARAERLGLLPCDAEARADAVERVEEAVELGCIDAVYAHGCPVSG